MVCFHSELHVAGFAEVLPLIMNATTTEDQYRWGADAFSRRRNPPGFVLNWVCPHELDYLDLTNDRLVPSRRTDAGSHPRDSD